MFWKEISLYKGRIQEYECQEKKTGKKAKNCKGRMQSSYGDKSKGLWVVIIFDDNHNHPLVNTPAMVAKLRSRKKVIPSCETMIDDLHKCHQRFHK